jgi:hypothetical protein
VIRGKVRISGSKATGYTVVVQRRGESARRIYTTFDPLRGWAQIWEHLGYDVTQGLEEDASLPQVSPLPLVPGAWTDGTA